MKFYVWYNRHCLVACTAHFSVRFCTCHLFINESCVAQIVALGFEPEAAKAALQKHRNNVQNAVDDLIKHNGVMPSSTEESSSSSGSGRLLVFMISFADVG